MVPKRSIVTQALLLLEQEHPPRRSGSVTLISVLESPPASKTNTLMLGSSESIVANNSPAVPAPAIR